MSPLKKKKLFLSLIALVSLKIVMLILYILFSYRVMINLTAFLWMFGFVVAVIMLAIGILFAHDALNCGRKRKDVRLG
ncbi:hypothetical protein BC343_09935 [Mucilaginibacter pedocola]|uniref:Uncharacterized protein n=1 Tax=Mucilaginibacter pedocola TaxID=1792845 RepID=A0A1S9PAM4_9SPHI|nr:hypothetical protein BC343_09935 [Mucilaginibacter pedocola]